MNVRAILLQLTVSALFPGKWYLECLFYRRLQPRNIGAVFPTVS